MPIGAPRKDRQRGYSPRCAPKSDGPLPLAQRARHARSKRTSRKIDENACPDEYDDEREKLRSGELEAYLRVMTTLVPERQDGGSIEMTSGRGTTPTLRTPANARRIAKAKLHVPRSSRQAARERSLSIPEGRQWDVPRLATAVVKDSTRTCACRSRSAKLAASTGKGPASPGRHWRRGKHNARPCSASGGLKRECGRDRSPRGLRLLKHTQCSSTADTPSTCVSPDDCATKKEGIRGVSAVAVTAEVEYSGAREWGLFSWQAGSERDGGGGTWAVSLREHIGINRPFVRVVQVKVEVKAKEGSDAA
ncbi:hypothetical protein B0H16DRAFT_1459649 [Mycena metata]|uniref:Uncharacterized protein n=1 Tax=Mycena metata TaxID=1033252 RepID=A0AAD7IY30_9AGAR|nr:hypothetical protein B0H16DRAFT_1459649 [Mycena metata]